MNKIEKLQNEIEQLKVDVATIKNEWQAEKARNYDLQKQNVESTNKAFVAIATVKNEWQSEKFYFQELEKSFEQKINNLPNYDMAVKIVKTELDSVLSERNEQLRTELIEVIEFEIGKKIVAEVEKINQIMEQLPSKLSETKREIFRHLDNLKTMAAAVKIADYELQKFFNDNYREDYR